jgi:hypothetical protein
MAFVPHNIAIEYYDVLGVHLPRKIMGNRQISGKFAPRGCTYPAELLTLILTTSMGVTKVI